MLTFAQKPDGTQIAIAEIEAMPKPRPRVTCFECDRVLTPRVGKKRAWHFAHKKGVYCDAASGEGRLHSEAKQHLRRELQQLINSRGNLFSHATCATCPGSILIPIMRFAEADDVVLEKRHGGRLRPDVTVVRGGLDILFFEIVATNPCDDAKWAQVDAWKLPLAEVAAEDLVCLDDRAADWSHTQPLRLARHLRIFESRECDRCRESREHAAAQRRQQEAAAAAEAGRKQHEAAAAAEARRKQDEIASIRSSGLGRPASPRRGDWTGLSVEHRYANPDVEWTVVPCMAAIGGGFPLIVCKYFQCSICRGSGRSGSVSCFLCLGLGVVVRQFVFVWVIPADVKDGTVLRHKGVGNENRDGVAADVYIRVRLRSVWQTPSTSALMRA